MRAPHIQPFIVTLAGMFFARGLCYVISVVVGQDRDRRALLLVFVVLQRIFVRRPT